MRFLADAGISPKTVDLLRSLNHIIDHVRALGLERADDRQLVDVAAAGARVIATFDLDFGEILALGVLDKPSVITLRLSDERSDSVNLHLSAVLADCAAELEAGALVLVEDARYRVRKLPIGRKSS